MKASDLLAPSAVRARPQAPHPDPLPASGERGDASSSESLVLFSIDTKRDEPGLLEAGRMLGMKLVFLPLEALLARKDDVITRAVRVERLTGVGSVAEAAALAGAGQGSTLLAPRMATARLTCAIARACLRRTDDAS
ncbi:MAG: cobalamin biosynthesis protein [Methylocystis sp.]|nr:cobalamin biosynthesis protein [Methylocystis sp.]